MAEFSRRFYAYEEFVRDTKIVVDQVKILVAPAHIDAVIAVARGGVVLGLFAAEALGVHSFSVINATHYDASCKLDELQIGGLPAFGGEKTVLVTDEIVDSGETMQAVIALLQARYPAIRFVTAVLVQKPTAIFRADVAAQESDIWIDFFWENAGGYRGFE